jgi:tRNA-specific 2-thiouridylase
MVKNQVYVSTNLNDKNFWLSELKLSDTHWINDPPLDGETYQVRLRHRGKLIDCQTENDIIKLQQPERAIAPGQSAVIYKNQLVLGGGIVVG